LEFSNHELASRKDKLIIGGQVEAKDERKPIPYLLYGSMKGKKTLIIRSGFSGGGKPWQWACRDVNRFTRFEADRGSYPVCT